MNRRQFFAAPYVLWMAVFVLIPIILIFIFAFTSEEGGVTLRNFSTMGNYVSVFARSFLLALISTVICLALGYPAACFMARETKRRQSVLMLLVMLPMWMNFLLRTYAWLVLLDNNGLLNSLFALLGLPKTQMLYTQNAVVLGMVYNFLPFMVLPIHSVLVKIDKYQIEAAEDLGADSLTVFRKVIFPQSIPGVITGITMVFVPAITTFAISRLLGGSQFMLFGDLIENQFIFVQNWHFGSALSLIMLALVLLSLALTNKFDRADDGGRLW